MNNASVTLTWAENIQYRYYTESLLSAIKAIFAFSSGARSVRIIQIQKFIQINESMVFAKSLHARHCDDVNGFPFGILSDSFPMSFQQVQVPNFSASTLYAQADGLGPVAVAVFVRSFQDVAEVLKDVLADDTHAEQIGEFISQKMHSDEVKSEGEDFLFENNFYSDLPEGVTYIGLHKVDCSVDSIGSVVAVRFANHKRLLIGIDTCDGVPVSEETFQSVCASLLYLCDGDQSVKLIIPKLACETMEKTQEIIETSARLDGGSLTVRLAV